MPGRPTLPIGQLGAIRATQLGDRRWVARARIRDPDGHTRQIKRQGRSRSAAENALRAAAGQRGRPTGAELGPDSRVSDAAALWLGLLEQRVVAGERSPRTIERYRDAWRLHVAPGLGALRLREVSTARCEAWQTALRARRGPATVKGARAVLSGVLGYAARMDALPGNPVRELSAVPGGRARRPRAMTADERRRWLTAMDTADAAAAGHRGGAPRGSGRALGDISRFMLGTGCRIGECMAVSWDEVDLEGGTVAIRWRLVRVRGAGLQRLPGAKSEAGDRVLRLPSWCLDVLMRRRLDELSAYPVFADALGGWRDPGLVSRWIREARDGAGMGWVTSHVWRQTVITVLDAAGLSTREVADQAGHSRIAQTQSYMARRIASDRAAEVLEDMV